MKNGEFDLDNPLDLMLIQILNHINDREEWADADTKYDNGETSCFASISTEK